MFTHPRSLIDVDVAAFFSYLNAEYQKSSLYLGNTGVKLIYSDRLYGLLMDGIGEDSECMLHIPAAATVTLPSDSCTGSTTVCLANTDVYTYPYQAAVLTHEIGHVLGRHTTLHPCRVKDLLRLDVCADEYVAQTLGVDFTLEWLKDLLPRRKKFRRFIERRILALEETKYV